MARSGPGEAEGMLCDGSVCEGLGLDLVQIAQACSGALGLGTGRQHPDSTPPSVSIPQLYHHTSSSGRLSARAEERLKHGDPSPPTRPYGCAVQHAVAHCGAQQSSHSGGGTIDAFEEVKLGLLPLT